MSPIQVYYICDVCGKRTLREDETMGRMRITYDTHEELLVYNMVCRQCLDAMVKASRLAALERRGTGATKD